jgi:hypothetical protein
MVNKKQVVLDFFLVLIILFGFQIIQSDIVAQVVKDDADVFEPVLNYAESDGEIITLQGSFENLTIGDLNWSLGSFSTGTGSLVYIGLDGFIYDINDSFIHLLEVGGNNNDPYDGSYVTFGAYAVMPVIDGFLNFTFDGRARAGHPDAVQLGIRIYDLNFSWILSSSSNSEYLDSISATGELDSGWIQFNNSVPLVGHSAAIVYIGYNDHWAADWSQEIWVTNLNVLAPLYWSAPEIPDLFQTPPSNITIGDLNWTFGLTPRDLSHTQPLFLSEGTGYSYTINDNMINVKETTGTFDVWVGAYAEVPVVDGFLNFSFVGRAAAGHVDAVRLRMGIYDNVSRRELYYEHGISSPGSLDSGWINFNFSYNLQGNDSAILFFYYGDGFSANWNQEFWVNDLLLFSPINWSEPEPPVELDDIFEENDDFPSAQTIGINQTYSLYAFDDDYFTLNLTRFDHIDLRLDFNDVEVDLDLYLCDWVGDIIENSVLMISPETISYDCTYSGVYFIVVTYFDGLNGSNYQLNLELTTSSIIDDDFEDNEYIEEAAVITEGTYNLFYQDRDIYKISLETGYTYTFTLTFNDVIIDLDMYILSPDFDGDEEDILAWSELYTSPEEIKYSPSFKADYYLLILAYLEDEESVIIPTEYMLKIVKGEKEEDTWRISFPAVVISITILAVIVIYKFNRGTYNLRNHQ